MKNYKPRKRLKCCGNCRHVNFSVIHNHDYDAICMRNYVDDIDDERVKECDISGICDEWKKR